MSIGDWKFGTRIALSFGVVLLLLAAALGVGISSINKLRREAQVVTATQQADAAGLRAAVDQFFEDVMVMAEEPLTRIAKRPEAADFMAQARAEEAKNGVPVAYAIPKEGAASFFDMMAIPADAKNVDAAHTFLNYILTPEVIAPISDYVAYPNGNSAATPLVSEEVRNNPGIYPTAEASKKLYTFTELSPKVQRAITRSWTKVKSGR